MLVGTLSLCHLFDKNVHHIVPLFQRPYVWERETQWQPLWDDTQRLAERLLTKQPVRSHFLGATVHEKKAVPPGSIETRLVIDGQQRLTTLQLLLQAFTDVATASGFETYGAALRNLTRNNHPLRQRPQEDFKLWPTNADRADSARQWRAAPRKPYDPRSPQVRSPTTSAVRFRTPTCFSAGRSRNG